MALPDGYTEERVKAIDVVVGTIIHGKKRTKTDAWEVIDMAHGAQVHGYRTLWWKVRNIFTGEEATIPPRVANLPITVLVPEGEQRPTAHTPPSDAAEIMLLVEKLGATILARQDSATGEITCPNYSAGHHWTDDWQYRREELAHLRIAHDVDTTRLEALEGNEAVVEIVRVHDQAHDPRYPALGKGGFPHRHVPEDHTTM